MNSISIVGSGLTGTLLAASMAQASQSVVLYERRADPRIVSQPAGRSINLALSARGLYALEQIGLKDKVLEQALPMRGRMIHDLSGKTHFQAYGSQPHEYINSISRVYLNQVLMDAAETSGVQIHFEQRCTGMDFENRQAHFVDDRSGKEYMMKQTPVIAADGAGSALRKSLTQRVRVNYSQDYLEHGYKELTIPPTAEGDFAMDPGALHIWPRQRFMLIALPNPDRSFTCTLFLAFEATHEAPGFDQIRSDQEILAFFESYFPDIIPILPGLLQEFKQNPVGALATVRTAPWHLEDQLLLLGDAAHAIVPFFGQGMNAGFEDCSLLMKLLPDFGSDWKALFESFYMQRKVDADAIADLALENFIEMRDRVNDPEFVLHKQVGLELEKRYPEIFVPKYSLVSFHRVPYSVALKHGELQKQLLQKLCQHKQQIEHINWELASELIAQFEQEAPALDKGLI